ncbi:MULTISPECIES: hypothetical protein [Idiomarina]|uniref:hypothetical protein n=1 Tax=Idiomarina TaxID=135575 RepID=UPI00129BCCA2|nr:MULTISPECIES: hypothetical protein [Idiomarina]MRJ41171.1 hypothetical protein [Idiomarina sp. FeN1]NCU56336.1 hypothetical protein [Idiomarina sp. FenA--70]NCU59355.1 hypothetical protein [Idiomarina sp. FenBw--71]UUN12530.1 hypothetical protein KGF88_07625 [Idiomarina loihiensis]
MDYSAEIYKAVLKAVHELGPCSYKAIRETLDLEKDECRDVTDYLIEHDYLIKLGNLQIKVAARGESTLERMSQGLDVFVSEDEPEFHQDEKDDKHIDEPTADTEKQEVKPQKPVLGTESFLVMGSPSRSWAEHELARARSVVAGEDDSSSGTNPAGLSESAAAKMKSHSGHVYVGLHTCSRKHLESLDTDELLWRIGAFNAHLKDIKDVVNSRVNRAFFPLAN